jgi:hypothetical protein
MALEKIVVNDKIEAVLNDVWNFSTVQVRTATIVREDGTDLSRSYSRHVVAPLDDITSEDADVQAICNVVFTQECKDNYQAFLDAQPVTP